MSSYFPTMRLIEIRSLTVSLLLARNGEVSALVHLWQSEKLCIPYAEKFLNTNENKECIYPLAPWSFL